MGAQEALQAFPKRAGHVLRESPTRGRKQLGSGRLEQRKVLNVVAVLVDCSVQLEVNLVAAASV